MYMDIDPSKLIARMDNENGLIFLYVNKQFDLSSSGPRSISLSERKTMSNPLLYIPKNARHIANWRVTSIPNKHITVKKIINLIDSHKGYLVDPLAWTPQEMTRNYYPRELRLAYTGRLILE